MLSLLVTLAAPAAAAELVSTSTEGFDEVTVELRGLVQPRLLWGQQDPDAGHDGELGFDLRRVRLTTGASFLTTADADAPGGWRGPGLDLGLSVELMPEARLFDAYADVRLAHAAQLRVGQFKSPTTRSMLMSAERVALPDLQAIAGMAPDREMGAMLHGFVGRHHLAWAGGAFNGEGINRLSNVNRELLWAGRIELSPLGAPGRPEEVLRPDWRLRGGDVPVGAYNPDTTFTLAGHGFRNVEGVDGERQGTWGLGADLFFHWRWVNLTAAWLTGAVQWEDPAIADSTFGGWAGQLVLFPPGVPWAQEHLALVSRIEQHDSLVPDEGAAVPLVNALDPAQAQRDLTFGALFFLHRPFLSNLHQAKLGATWTVRQELEDLGYDNDELMLTGQLAF